MVAHRRSERPDENDLVREVSNVLGQPRPERAPNKPSPAVEAPDIRAGHPAPAPSAFADVAVVHAIDGDGAALCEAYPDIEQVDDFHWDDVPPTQRCPHCALILDH